MSYYDLNIDEEQSKVNLEVSQLHSEGLSYDEIVDIVHGTKNRSILQVVRAYENVLRIENAAKRFHSMSRKGKI